MNERTSVAETKDGTELRTTIKSALNGNTVRRTCKIKDMVSKRKYKLSSVVCPYQKRCRPVEQEYFREDCKINLQNLLGLGSDNQRRQSGLKSGGVVNQV